LIPLFGVDYNDSGTNLAGLSEYPRNADYHRSPQPHRLFAWRQKNPKLPKSPEPKYFILKATTIVRCRPQLFRREVSKKSRAKRPQACPGFPALSKNDLRSAPQRWWSP